MSARSFLGVVESKPLRAPFSKKKLGVVLTQVVAKNSHVTTRVGLRSVTLTPRFLSTLVPSACLGRTAGLGLLRSLNMSEVGIAIKLCDPHFLYFNLNVELCYEIAQVLRQ